MLNFTTAKEHPRSFNFIHGSLKIVSAKCRRRLPFDPVYITINEQILCKRLGHPNCNIRPGYSLCIIFLHIVASLGISS